MATAISYAIDGSGSGRRVAPVARQPSVLVVDDEQSVRQLVQELLEDEGLRVFTAASGHEAYAIALRERVDLIITDLMMPGMSGRALGERLRATSRTARIPVLLMTAAGRLRADDPFDGFISKPFDITTLLDEISRHIAIAV
jgi:CheY-like chemotaxis protein